jgi:hypothetical protein
MKNKDLKRKNKRDTIPGTSLQKKTFYDTIISQ